MDQTDPELFRPHGHRTGAYRETNLSAGWHEVLIKLVRRTAEPLEAHFCLLDHDDRQAGITDVRWTRFPWEARR